MTGPEHYRSAEVLISGMDHEYVEDPARVEAVALAQAHATLALAAATAMSARPAGPSGVSMHLCDFNAWDDVAGVQLSD